MGVGDQEEKKSLGGIIQKSPAGTIASTPPPQSDYINSPTLPPDPLHTKARERRKNKMNSLRAVSRVALRAKPTRSLFAATRTYADAAGPADKIRLSLALPHQVRGHSTVGIVLWRYSAEEQLLMWRAPVDYLQSFGCVRFAAPSSSSSPHFVSRWWWWW